MVSSSPAKGSLNSDATFYAGMPLIEMTISLSQKQNPPKAITSLYRQRIVQDLKGNGRREASCISYGFHNFLVLSS